MGVERGADGFALFVSAQGTALLRTAVLLSGGDLHHGEDLLQTSLMKVYRHWRKASVNPTAYTRRVMAHGATDRWRSLRRRPHEVQGVPPEHGHPHQAPLADQVAESAWAAELLRSLTRGQRAVVVLRYYEDLTERETAEALGVSVGTVKSQTARALGRLRELAGPGATIAASGEPHV